MCLGFSGGPFQRLHPSGLSWRTQYDSGCWGPPNWHKEQQTSALWDFGDTQGELELGSFFFVFLLLASHCCHTSNPFLSSESRLSRRQRVPFCFRLHLLQWREPHGAVMLSLHALSGNDFAFGTKTRPRWDDESAALIQLCPNLERFSAVVLWAAAFAQLVFLGDEKPVILFLPLKKKTMQQKMISYYVRYERISWLFTFNEDTKISLKKVLSLLFETFCFLTRKCSLKLKWPNN